MNEIIIIGGGCAGLTAAIYCARAGLKPLLFAGDLENKGGLLMKTSVVENYPGFPDGISGYELISNMEQQASKYGAKIVDIEIVKVDFSKKPFAVVDSEDNIHYSSAVIICTGSEPNKLSIERENYFWSNGISSCAVCDGALYRDKKIIVIGGGDSAMEEALFLTKFSDVILIHRRNTFKASKIMQERVMNEKKIKIIYNTIVVAFYGEELLETIRCRNLSTGEEFTLDVDGLFYGLGLKPNTKIFCDISKDYDQYIINGHHYETGTIKNFIIFDYKSFDASPLRGTSIEGIFVAGDSADKHYRQAIVACGDGCKAALDAIDYLDRYK